MGKPVTQDLDITACWIFPYSPWILAKWQRNFFLVEALVLTVLLHEEEDLLKAPAPASKLYLKKTFKDNLIQIKQLC